MFSWGFCNIPTLKYVWKSLLSRILSNHSSCLKSKEVSPISSQDRDAIQLFLYAAVSQGYFSVPAVTPGVIASSLYPFFKCTVEIIVPGYRKAIQN